MSQPTSARDAGLRETLLSDLKQLTARRSLRRDFGDLYRFYLDEERRTELAAMRPPKRAVLVTFWLIKSLLLRLSPGRRLAVFGALLLFLSRLHWRWHGNQVIDVDLLPFGFVLLLVVFMLELKDKLLARDEIEVARQVQIALLPREDPHVAGWSLWSATRPANDVGGDLIDYMPLEGSRLGIALGDVAGKGLGAALLMAKLQATLRAVRPSCLSLADLGARLIEILERDGLINRFATLFYCEVEPGSGRVRYLNAGHNPPFVLRPGGIETLPPSSLPLGMYPGTCYSGEQVELEPGETLLIYSDGVTEARDGREEEFGEERLRSELSGLKGVPGPEAGRRILARVDAFTGGARPHDDLSLVVLVRQVAAPSPITPS